MPVPHTQVHVSHYSYITEEELDESGCVFADPGISEIIVPPLGYHVICKSIRICW